MEVTLSRISFWICASSAAGRPALPASARRRWAARRSCTRASPSLRAPSNCPFAPRSEAVGPSGRGAASPAAVFGGRAAPATLALAVAAQGLDRRAGAWADAADGAQHGLGGAALDVAGDGLVGGVHRLPAEERRDHHAGVRGLLDVLGGFDAEVGEGRRFLVLRLL